MNEVDLAAQVREWHDKAMACAEQAASWRRLGDKNSARLSSTFAHQYERTAASLCTDEPSRSVLYRSAATLALDAGDPREARRLAECGLSGNPPQEIADELREVLAKAESVA